MKGAADDRPPGCPVPPSDAPGRRDRTETVCLDLSRSAGFEEPADLAYTKIRA